MPGMPQQIGEYRIERTLGAGAMSEVLLGQRQGPHGFSRAVAIKRLHPELARDETVVTMFIDEARITSRMSHENIAQVVDFGRTADSFFIAMEYVEGWSVEDLASRLPQRRLAPPMAAHVVAKVCAALDYAHRMTGDDGVPLEVVHRDVKPSNVLISREGRIKLIDFGVAKAARRLHQTVGMVLKGSYAYMSPEQANNEPVDGRSDIFSAGTVLYELLAGENPFVGVSPVDTLERVRHARIPSLSSAVSAVPDELERICRRAMAEVAADRYETAAAMQVDLERYCRQQPGDVTEALLAPLTAGREQEPVAERRERTVAYEAEEPPRQEPVVGAQATRAGKLGAEPAAEREPALLSGGAREATAVIDEPVLSTGPQPRPGPVEDRDLLDGGFEEDIDTETLSPAAPSMMGLDEDTDVETEVVPNDLLGPAGGLHSVPTTLPSDSFPELKRLIGGGPPRGRPGGPPRGERPAVDRGARRSPRPQEPAPADARAVRRSPPPQEPAAVPAPNGRVPRPSMPPRAAAPSPQRDPAAPERRISTSEVLPPSEPSPVVVPQYSSLKVVVLTVLATLALVGVGLLIWFL